MSKQSGQSLVEVLVALVVATIMIVGLVTVVIASLRNAQFAQNQTQATKYAQEAIDIIRGIRDRNEDNGVADYGGYGERIPFSDLLEDDMSVHCGGPCYFRIIDKNTVSRTSGPSREDLGDGLSREILMSNYGATDSGEKRLTVKVYWSDAAGEHESNLETILSLQ